MIAASSTLKLCLFCLALLVNHSVAFGPKSDGQAAAATTLAALKDELPFSAQQRRIETLEGKALQWHLKRWNLRMDSVVGEKIVGGVSAEEGEAPFQAQLFRKTWSAASFLCGGSLISPRTVLSAGHCVTNSYYAVRYGSNSRLKSPYPELSLQTIRQHPNFTLATVQNDIALFILESAIQPGANVRAVELHTEEVAEKDNMTLFGFGLVNGVGFKPAFDLQKSDMQIVSEKECEAFIENLQLAKSDGMFCARSPGRSACNGDSGGPLIAKESGRQAGIVSFGTRFCPEGSINVYTKVSHYIDWIKENME